MHLAEFATSKFVCSPLSCLLNPSIMLGHYNGDNAIDNRHFSPIIVLWSCCYMCGPLWTETSLCRAWLCSEVKLCQVFLPMTNF